jgi:hypothetical protein
MVELLIGFALIALCCVPILVFVLGRKEEHTQAVEGKLVHEYEFHQKPSLKKFRAAMFRYFPRGAREHETHAFHKDLAEAFEQLRSGSLSVPKLEVASFLEGISDEFKPFVTHLNTVSQASEWYKDVRILTGVGEVLSDEDDFFEEYEAMYIIALVLVLMPQVSNWTSSHVLCIQKPFYDSVHHKAFYVEGFIQKGQVHFRHSTSHAYCRYHHLKVGGFPV